MKEIIGSTSEEVALIKAIQRATGAYDNGVIGTDTLTCLAQKVGAKCFPLAVKMYGCPTVIGKSCLPFNPRGGIKPFAYTISGSFTWKSGENPCSILVNRGKVEHGYACHAYKGNPESVLFQLADGRFGIKRCMYSTELPNDVVWAVGGMGLLGNYNPTFEGFTGADAGVLRKTGHTVLGFKNGHVYGICFPNHSSSELNGLVKSKFKLDGAIQLDGGSVFYYNLADMQKDTNWKCGYAIQFLPAI